MNNTKIDWCDKSLNPVVGCDGGCGYCYAKKMNQRYQWIKDFSKPQYFPERLQQLNTRKGYSIFMDSMSDIGHWEEQWMQEIFNACDKNSQHRYLFLTKNPKGVFDAVIDKVFTPRENMWFGFSVISQQMLDIMAFQARYLPNNFFISIEPIHAPVDLMRIHPVNFDVLFNFLNGGQYWFLGGDQLGRRLQWIIVGAETGNRKGKVIPKREWIESIADQCKAANVPLFMKGSLSEIWGEPLIQEFPW